MKKNILTAATLFALSFANAQGVKFGAKGGMNLSTFTNINVFITTRMRVGFHAGGFAEIMLAEKLAIQPEVLYSSQGIKLKQVSSESSTTANFNLAYLNVPIMVKYFVTKQFTVEAGPQIGFLLSAKNKYEAKVGDVSGSGTDDVTDLFSSTDFGMNLGLGYEFYENIICGIRSNLGWTKVQKKLEEGEEASKNRVIQFSLGYKF